MTTIILILVAGTVIVAIGTAAFVLIVINIQAVDRSKRLMQEPRSVLDAATRRILGATPRRPGPRQMKAS